MAKSITKLLGFYGEECPHCQKMEPLIQRLKEEENLEVEQIEVWHNQQNAETMQKYDLGYCGGVPFFINTETGKWLCGETDYDKFKDWARGL